MGDFEEFVQKWLFIGIALFYFASLAGFFFIGWNIYGEGKNITIPLVIAYILLALLMVAGGYGSHKYWGS